MTTDEINALPAGHELDAAVHAKVMGRPLPTQEEMRTCAQEIWKVQPSCQVFNDLGGFQAVPRDAEASNQDFAHDLAVFEAKCRRYSADMAAAWLVVEKMRELKLSVYVGDSDNNGWHCLVATDEGTPSFWRQVADAEAETAPHAICKAALMAAEREELHQ